MTSTKLSLILYKFLHLPQFLASLLHSLCIVENILILLKLWHFCFISHLTTTSTRRNFSDKKDKRHLSRNLGFRLRLFIGLYWVTFSESAHNLSLTMNIFHAFFCKLNGMWTFCVSWNVYTKLQCSSSTSLVP
jgi:hypothetical protein